MHVKTFYGWISVAVIFSLTLFMDTDISLSLPPLLKSDQGEQITSVQQWETVRRPELIQLFETHIYGRAPEINTDQLQFKVLQETDTALSGRATFKHVRISFQGPNGTGSMRLYMYIPNHQPAPTPLFLLINHRTPAYMDIYSDADHTFWPVEHIIDRGYATASFINSDLDPYSDDGFKNGVHGLFDPQDQPRPPDAWGSIAAWGWGARRAMDYLVTDPLIDSMKIAIVGHSRGGKTALWAGAIDQRFALVISNNSGIAGAALARRSIGQTIEKVNTTFPHWFCTNYKRYNKNENKLPIDQHQLLALIAPRLLYVASATVDYGADPKGEFLACIHAEPAYELYGLRGVSEKLYPPYPPTLHDGQIGYHLRKGKHNLTVYDWTRFMNFADRHWD